MTTAAASTTTTTTDESHHHLTATAAAAAATTGHRAQANQVFATALDTAIEQHAMATPAGGGRHEKYKAVAVRTATAHASSPPRISLQVQGRRRGAGVRRAQCRGEAAEIGARAVGRRAGQGALACRHAHSSHRRHATPLLIPHFLLRAGAVREERRPRSGEVEGEALHASGASYGRRRIARHSVRGASLCFLVAFTCFGATLLLSEATLPLYFFPGLPADDSDAAAAAAGHRALRCPTRSTLRSAPSTGIGSRVGR